MNHSIFSAVAMSHWLKRLVPSRLKVSFRDFAWRRLNASWTLRSGLPIHIRSYAEWIIYNDIFVDGEYDPVITDTLDHARSQSLVALDLGANVGFFVGRLGDLSLRRPGMRCEVICVEGSPAVARELSGRLDEIRSDALRAKMIHGLVGAREGHGFIEETEFHVMNKVTAGGRADGQRVAFINLDEVCEHFASIDLLKCDIEGSELLFLKNYPRLMSKVARAVFEFHHADYPVGEAVKLLQTYGFGHHQVLREAATFSVHYFKRNDA